MTAAHRLAWFTAGAATTLASLASLAALAVHWGRAVERTEGYGTWMAEPPEPETWEQYWRDSVDYARMQEAARVNWHRETRQVGPPLRVEPYRPEGTT